MKILITGGGTREPIDGVRFITNFSTGATAAALADCFADAGDQVSCLMSEGAILPCHRDVSVFSYSSFDSLDQAMRRALAAERYEAIVHLAAVSDYSVESIWDGDRRIEPSESGKLDSRGGLTLKLKPNFKILGRLKDYAREAGYRRSPCVIAFKLTDTPIAEARTEAVRRLFSGSDIDFAVHNDIGDRRAGCPKFTVFDQKFRTRGECADARSLGEALAKVLQEEMI